MIKSAMEKATKQGAQTVVLIQQTGSMNRAYVESQIKLFKTKSPRRAVAKLNNVVVIGLNDSVYRRKL